MPDMLPSVFDVLIKAFKESEGRTVDLVIEHGELSGVTPEMMQWWGLNINDTARYRMWYPEDHVSFRWEVPPGKGQTRIGLAEEKVGEFPASVLRLRGEDRSLVPFPVIYENYRWSSILGPDDKPIACLCHEYQGTDKGIIMRSTFRFPARTPKRFLEAMHRHCQGEMGHLPEFLPELYRRHAG